MDKIRMIETEISKINIYPGERIYIKCKFQALEDEPVSKGVKLFADLHFGHMFIDKTEKTYYRETADMYPMPAHWRKGEIWSSTVVWNVPKNIWGGVYKAYVGLMDNDTCPISFSVDDKKYKRYHAADINVAFNDVAKEYMKKHSEKVIFTYASDNIPSVSYDHSYDAFISVRNTKTDEEIKTAVVLNPQKAYTDKYVSFKLQKDEHSYYLDDIKEKSGYELLYVKMPLMFTHRNAKMITMYGEGRIVNPEKAYPWGYEQAYWIRNVAILSNNENNVIIETPFLDDKLNHSVCELNGKRFCAIGVTFTYRIRAYGDLKSIKVINAPAVTVKRVDGRWQNCLSELRGKITKKTNMYDRSLFYYNNICQGPGAAAQTFDEALDKIKKINHLTFGVRQYMLLCGWQHDGHDTGYPDVFEINKRCGTVDDLKRCVNESKKYNACMTFHDNYDDIYEENGYFDKDIAAMGENGKYFTSWIWTAGVSVMTGYKKYFKTGKLQERVKKTVELLPVDKSYHIDVLSQEARRYDFTPGIESAAQETLEYKLDVIKEFEKYGITITSEGLTHPFAGKIGYAWRLNANRNTLFADEEIIPLTAMIYHGIVPYSAKGVNAVIFGGNMVPPNPDDEKGFKREFFLKALPVGLLCNEFIEDYSFNNGIHNITYSNDSCVIYDEVNDEITVKHNGIYITRNGITLAKGYSENEYFGYSESGTYKVKNTLKKAIAGIYNQNGEKITYTAGEDIIVNCKSGEPFRIVLEA